MKMISFFILMGLMSLVGCTKDAGHSQDDARVAALEKRIDEMKPGFGEIMGVIQQHHAKLYFSGNRGNWELAQYQLDEIKEGLEDVTKYYPTFKEVKLPIKNLVTKMMDEPLALVAGAIQKKDKKAFTESFNAMTKSCNSCHQAAEHGFVVVQAPTGAEFTNQKFSP